MPMEYSGFPPPASPRVLVMTRRFDVPRIRVWQAWADPAQAKCWAGPRGYSVTQVEGDWRPGGAWRLCLQRDDNGALLWQGGVYQEIVSPERLVYSFAWDNAQGQRGHETRITLTFTEHQAETRMGFSQETFESVEECDGHRGGWNSAFDRLAEHLTGVRSRYGRRA